MTARLHQHGQWAKAFSPLVVFDYRRPTGRLGLLWGAWYTFFLATCATVLLTYAFIPAEYHQYLYDEGVLDSVRLALGVVPLLLMKLRRLNDLGKSYWLILLDLVPVANVILIFYCLFAKGRPHEGPGWCDYHECHMKRHEVDERVWYSHALRGGAPCYGLPEEDARAADPQGVKEPPLQGAL
jgi:hypothetical protein